MTGGSPGFVKICGVTRVQDALHAVEQGASAIGFIFWARSARAVAPARAAEIVAELPAHVTTVGVFVNESIDGIRSIATATGIRAVQLHGDEPPAYARELEWPVIRAVTTGGANDACRIWPSDVTLLLDTIDPERRGGTGLSVDWTSAAAIARTRPLLLAGGLTPENIAEAISAVQPFGVDVSSGVEAAPGVKDPDKVTRFIANARRAFDLRAGVEMSAAPTLVADGATGSMEGSRGK